MSKALSLKQPWAQMVVRGEKSIETRRWRTLHHGPLLIHASKSFDDVAGAHFGHGPGTSPRGAIVGRVTLVRVQLFTEEMWHELRDEHCVPGRFHPGIYAWYVRDAVEFDEPIPCRGYPSLFDVDEVMAEDEVRE